MRLLLPVILLGLGIIILLWSLVNKPQIFRQTQWIAYLGHPLEDPEIWRVSMDGSKHEQLTETNGNVVDFAISADGKTIAFSVMNQAGGSDLWLVGISGKRARVLVNCETDICSQPNWSPQGRLVAYSRLQRSGIEPQSTSTERIWTVNVKSGKTGALFKETEITGKDPAFSPDGNRLAFYDTSKHAIHFFDLRSGKSEILPTQVEQVGAFSPDNTKMIFTEMDNDELPPGQKLFKVDISLQTITSLLSDNSGITDASDPTWSGQDGEIVFSAHSTQVSGRQLWIVNENGSGLHAITDDAAAVHAAARWSADGHWLIFQRLRLGSSENRPEIIIWNRTINQFTVLAEDAALPTWIP